MDNTQVLLVATSGELLKWRDSIWVLSDLEIYVSSQRYYVWEWRTVKKDFFYENLRTHHSTAFFVLVIEPRIEQGNLLNAVLVGGAEERRT